MIEIQIHPSDIRRNVRYFFFERRVVVFALAAGTFVLAVVIASMFAAPSVMRRAYKTNYLRAMRELRVGESRELKQHVDEMTELEKGLEENRVRVEKLMTIYGLSEAAVLGTGGFSLPVDSMHGDSLTDLTSAKRREQMLVHSMVRLQSQLEYIARFEAANSDLVRHTPSILPLPVDQFVLTSPFGTRISPFTRSQDFHKGLDLAASTGTPVFATADGVVTFAGRFPLPQSVAWWRFGNVVVINHANHFITIYGHCDTVNVHPGQSVKQGDSIATVGSTGWSTNSHLHYEVRTDLQRPGNYDPVDPRIYILNYQWNNEETLLIKARAAKDFRNFDPLPTAFIGRRGA